MEEIQLDLYLMGRIDGPSLVLPHVMRRIKSYREAVKTCWELRRRRAMTRQMLAEEVGLYSSHVTWYLNDGKRQLDLPGSFVQAFERVCGNTCISQFLAEQSKLRLTQSMDAMAHEMELQRAGKLLGVAA